MRSGEIKTRENKVYKSVQDYAKNFKAFWHWHQKVNRKKGIDIPDITVDLDTSGTKPDWVYLNEEQIRELCDKAKYVVGCYRLNEEIALFCGFKNLNELENYSNHIREDYNNLFKIKHIHIISPKGVIKESFDDLYLKLLNG